MLKQMLKQTVRQFELYTVLFENEMYTDEIVRIAVPNDRSGAHRKISRRLSENLHSFLCLCPSWTCISLCCRSQP